MEYLNSTQCLVSRSSLMSMLIFYNIISFILFIFLTLHSCYSLNIYVVIWWMYFAQLIHLQRSKCFWFLFQRTRSTMHLKVVVQDISRLCVFRVFPFTVSSFIRPKKKNMDRNKALSPDQKCLTALPCENWSRLS